MKKILLITVLFALVRANIIAQMPDLQSAATSYQPTTLPTGSYVIPMDNTNQGNGTIFNVKAYGLIVYLLNNNVRLRWVIQPGKAKDANDFSVNASRVKPSVVATSLKNFKAGPFVIFAGDFNETTVNGLIDTYNNTFNSGTDINVFKTTADVTVDVRYDYQINGVIWKPNAAVLDDGGNADIHAGYFVLAGITFGANGTTTLSGNGKLSGTATKATNWEIQTSPDFVTNCFTFASEPHNTTAPNNVISGIRNFVQGGGNFLAQCEAVNSYENNVLGRFQTVNGVTDADYLANTQSTATSFPSPYLSYSQFEGAFSINKGGSLQNWRINAGGTINNQHDHCKASGDPTVIGAMVSKLLPSSQLGGMVFYLGNHTFGDDFTNQYAVNGFRMYMNAFLTPTNPQGSLQSAAVTVCASYPNPIVVNCSSTAGPANAYPLTFTLYEDLAPAGYNVGDPQIGSVVTFTAPNTAPGGSQITAPSLYNNSKNYVVAIRPASGCLQAKYLQSFCSTLPVDMKSFTAKRVSSTSGNVLLNWTTSTEINNSGFAIEVNKDGNNWQTLGFVPSQALDGNSNNELNYNFIDNNTSRSVSQYRLRQVDRDARYKYSEIRSVRGLDQKSGIIVYPNPSSDGKVNVVFDDASTIREISVIDMSGRMVKQMRNVATNNIQIENLVPGMYTLRVIVPSTGEQTVEKIVVTKR